MTMRVDPSRQRIAALAVAVSIPMLAIAGGEHNEAPAPSRQRELMHLLKQDCGSCHGLSLHGGLGPPLTVQALRARPSEGLVATIVHGRPGTAMPPWRRFVTESEARWLVDRLQAGDTNAAR